MKKFFSSILLALFVLNPSFAKPELNKSKWIKVFDAPPVMKSMFMLDKIDRIYATRERPYALFYSDDKGNTWNRETTLPFVPDGDVDVFSDATLESIYVAETYPKHFLFKGTKISQGVHWEKIIDSKYDGAAFDNKNYLYTSIIYQQEPAILVQDQNLQTVEIIDFQSMSKSDRPYDSVSNIVVDSHGNIYATNWEKGIYVYDKAKKSWLRHAKMYPSSRFHSMVIDKNDNFYVESDGYVWKSSDGGINLIKIAGGYYPTHNPMMQALETDSKGNVYVVIRYEGIFKLPAGDTEWVRMEAGLSEAVPETVAVDGSDNVYVRNSRDEVYKWMEIS